MDDYKRHLARTLAETGALFFADDLILKDGRPTPYFVNMAMFRTGRLCMELGNVFAEMMVSKDLVKDTDIILGPSYKGSAIALATSIALWKGYGYDLPFEYDRKEAKTHGEATGAKMMFVNNTFYDGCRVFVVDDVATSMGTKYELLEKIEAARKSMGIRIRVTGIGIAVDREQTTAVYDEQGNVIQGMKGKNAVLDFVDKSGVPVHTVAGIREVVGYLYDERVPVLINGKKTPIDDVIRARFDGYIKTYGIG
ncbi:Orotate phosphoribosyltransferase [uncultured Desulfobacterium sp.]|uniref:Orotate phosphoribosyltransferase n=1 Tax=uncultured Desulfobacterium sp. TaxID=201089 RepID=A0A445MSZ6_9BACT|nr:Orotate phosphoribosyltransferase [uncultured Desulfobacterium sp.]